MLPVTAPEPDPTKEAAMSTAPTAKLVPRAEYDAVAERYGLTIQDDWIEELERAYGVKL